MSITISQAAYWELFKEKLDEQLSTSECDEFDVTWKFPSQFGEGYWREIQLRDGVELAIANYHLHKDITIQLPEREHDIEYNFFFTGKSKEPSTSSDIGTYLLHGSGMAPVESNRKFATEQILEVTVHIDPNLFIANYQHLCSTVPPAWQHLIKSPSQLYYVRSDESTTAMKVAVQQILGCPFQGITKRMYLESKVWELMALLLEQELELRQQKRCICSLKPDDIDRIHHAKDILSKCLENPPSLIELARQVGLNDCTLKRGFRQVFGQTAFGFLHEYRLEKAQQLLEERQLNISEISQKIGFTSRSYFAASFRKKFGMTPRQYRSR